MKPSNEDIIQAIKETPALWNSCHPQFKIRLVKNELWVDLAKKFKITDEFLRKRWKNIKDNYRREVKKEIKMTSGPNPKIWTSSCNYYNSLSFMKEEILNTHLKKTQDKEDDKEDDESSLFEKIKVEEYIIDDIVPNSEASSPRSTCSESERQSPVHLESEYQNKRTYSEENETEIQNKRYKSCKESEPETRETDTNDDEDYLYFKSLLPIVRTMSRMEKLRLRGKINDLLLETFSKRQ